MKANFRVFCHSNRLCSVLPEHSDWQGMKDDQQRFLSLLGQLPVRLTGEQAAWVLNCLRLPRFSVRQIEATSECEKCPKVDARKTKIEPTEKSASKRD
jgi:hypothetical protein